MARLGSQANLGFIPLVDDDAIDHFGVSAATMIASYLTAPHGARIVDPCAGAGVALADIAAALGIPARDRYANELHDARADACRQVAAHVTACDALKSLQAPTGCCQLAYLNPPFDHDGAEEGGGRLEPKFFRRVVEDGRWVQPGGIVVIVTPLDVLQRLECRNHLARCYDDLHICVLPAVIRHYREAVVFGVIRTEPRRLDAQRREAQRLDTLLAGDLPDLALQDTPRYTLPQPGRIVLRGHAKQHRAVWFDASQYNPVQAQQDVIATGGAWRSKAATRARTSLDRTQLRPLFPLHKPQAALRIAAGAINGMEVTIGGQPQVIKGSTVEGIKTWTVEQEGAASTTVEFHHTIQQVPHIVTIDPHGTIRQFTGDQGLRTLLDTNPDTGTALLDAVATSAPPRYQLDMEPHVAAILAAIQPASGRSLRGYAPGLLPMQCHVAAAAVRALTTPDPGWDGQTPHSTIVAAEMGCGKSSMGLGIAALLYALEEAGQI